MHICVIIPVLDAFKGGNHLPLVGMLKDCECTILTNRVKPADLVLPPNVRVVTVPGKLGPFYYGIADHRFSHVVMRRFPPGHSFWRTFDVIHLNQTLGIQFLRLLKTGRPVVYFIHHPASVDRALALEETKGWQRWEWRLKYALPVFWQGVLCRSMPNIATVSRTAAQKIAHDYRCDMAKIHIVPNGVDGDHFVPDSSGTIAFDVIALGSFVHPRKGFTYLAQVYRLLGAAGLRMADVGRRSHEQEQILSSIPGVTRFGTIDDRRLRELLQQSACLISTSLYEGFGLSLIEALACGHPSFAFDGGAVGEVLQPIDPSLVVPLRDTAALTENVRAFLTHAPEERLAKGKEYRRQVMERYSLQASAKALEVLYKRIAH